MSGARRKIRVVAALIPAAGDAARFLVQQRLPDKARANLWEFPGGKVEAGEGDAQALARECKEELDVELKVGRRLWGTTHDYDDLTVNLELFAAVIVSGEPKTLGAQALKFCTFDEMKKLPFCEADVPLLEALASGEISPS
ncbi:MAG: (deoxy)nucleoside triphosphate pyrophosphohydrolase [Myxococcaceae bacterium]|nr:(deoxy)nucleoside triphosphate pyrophosphohydrolase [Myxococcaceae bacterium]